MITVNTDTLLVHSDDDQFTIPTYGGATYNYNVDCDDDGTDDLTAEIGNATCTYGSAGHLYSPDQ